MSDAPPRLRLVVVGAGGMGRCILDVVEAMNQSSTADVQVVGVVDDAPADVGLLESRGVPYLGPLTVVDDMPTEIGYVIGIADPEVRVRTDRRLGLGDRPSPVLMHPNAHRGFGVTMGPGSVVCSHVSIENNVTLGRHVHINQNSTIGHDTVLAQHCTVSPLVAVSGAIRADERVFLGTGASVRQGVRLGEDSVVGMGAAVVSDVAVGVTVVGVPARPSP